MAGVSIIMPLHLQQQQGSSALQQLHNRRLEEVGPPAPAILPRTWTVLSTRGKKDTHYPENLAQSLVSAAQKV